jgi:hypothetical protein
MPKESNKYAQKEVMWPENCFQFVSKTQFIWHENFDRSQWFSVDSWMNFDIWSQFSNISSNKIMILHTIKIYYLRHSHISSPFHFASKNIGLRVLQGVSVFASSIVHPLSIKFRGWVCKNNFRTPFPGLVQHLPQPRYDIILGTLWTKFVF